MIIIQAEGGLGNQMFQYAFALSFINKGIKVKLDLSKYETDHGHNGYEIERIFDLKAPYSSKTERALVKSLSKLRHVVFHSPYKEKSEWQWQHYEPVTKIKSGFLKGYWQSEKYFAAIASLVREKFTFPLLQDEANKAMLQKIKNCNAISIHIRRGDYLNSSTACAVTIGYYMEAMAVINKKVDDPYYFVFSDDIEWAKENIKATQVEFIGWNKGNNSYIDMQLMSRCRHNIIANSSFSWWGAWLNNNPGKIVITPQDWMPGMKDNKGIIPAEWIQLPNNFQPVAS